MLIEMNLVSVRYERGYSQGPANQSHSLLLVDLYDYKR